MATMRLAAFLLVIVACAHFATVRSEHEMEDYDRIYSDSVGHSCNPGFSTPLMETFECSSPFAERGDECWAECSEHCDDFENCAAFTLDGPTCVLWEVCDIIMAADPNNTSRSVHVCLENCPHDTQPWYAAGGFDQCSKKDRVGTIKLPCTPEGEGFDPNCDVRGMCADICVGTFFCTHFQVTFAGGNICTLFDDCKIKATPGENAAIGFIRERVIPDPTPQNLGILYSDWRYVSVDDSEPIKICSNLNKCLLKCPIGSIIVSNSETGEATCWEPGSGEWDEDDDHSTIITVNGGEVIPTDQPADDDGDEVIPSGCLLRFKNWDYVARGDDTMDKSFDNLIQCFDECGVDESVIVGKNGECDCWKFESGEWQRKKKAQSWRITFCSP